MKRFREAVGTVTDLNVPQALEFFTTGLDTEKSRKLLKDIMFNPLKDLSEAYDRAENFIAIDDAMGSLKPQLRKTDRPQDRDRSYDPRPETQPRREIRNGSVGNGQRPF